MSRFLIDVLENGAVRLGSNIVCDGFIEDYEFRVQTHIHEDHMVDFNRSKGLQDLIMTPETHALLIAEYNADLEYRSNIFPISRGETYVLRDGSRLALYPSGHMLGACQVAVELSDGFRIGYSGDFGWPLTQVIQVDQLIIDSTYGSPRSVRNYTQAEAEDCLLKIVCERLRYGPVHIKAHPGTIERVLLVLGESIGVPILASDRLIRRVEVYQRYGFPAGDLASLDSDDGRIALKERSYVRLYSRGDGFDNEPADGTGIICSAYMARCHPLRMRSDRAYQVALSNHADFAETLAYVAATGAHEVVTDNTRNHGVELAIAINSRFPHIHAQPSTNSPGPRWS